MGHFFSSSHLSTLVALFLLYHQKIFVPYIVLVTARLSLFRKEILFLLQNTLSTNVSVVSDQGWAIFFHCHTCLHLSRFFCCIIRKYLSHILFWSQLVSVCFAVKFFFSFKIYCLQMFQLFQTKDGPVFFIVTLVYTCRAFFAVSSENVCPIYCFGHSSSQSVSQWNSFFPLKYIVYKCFSCFRPRMGQFFSYIHIFVPYIFGCIIKIFEEKISLYNILYLSLLYIVLKIPKLKKVFVTVVTSLQRDETRPFGNPLSFYAIYAVWSESSLCA